MVSAALGRNKKVTLDIDASVIKTFKQDAKYSYKKYPAFTPMFGHIAETGQLAAVDFRAGNVPAVQTQSGIHSTV